MLTKFMSKIKGPVMLAALFACVVFLSNEVNQAVSASAAVGDRELPIYCVDTEEKKIALSFDAAWGAEDFSEIMDILDQHNVKVTFFMTGENVIIGLSQMTCG